MLSYAHMIKNLTNVCYNLFINFYKFFLILLTSSILFNISSAITVCPGDQLQITWNGSGAASCSNIGYSSPTASFYPVTGGAISGSRDLTGLKNNEGSYSITCNNGGGAVSSGDGVSFYNLSYCYNTLNRTQTIARTQFCGALDQNITTLTNYEGGYSIVANGLNNAGYVHDKYSYTLFPDENQVTSSTCNPCKVSLGETWNGVSGSGAICYTKPEGNMSIQSGASILNISCTNSTGFSLREKVDGITINTYTGQWSFATNNTATRDIKNGAVYELDCTRNDFSEDKKSQTATNVAILKVTDLKSNYPDTRGGDILNKDPDNGAEGNRYPVLNVSCSLGSAQIFKDGSSQIINSGSKDESVILTNVIQEVSYNAECKNNNISYGKVWLTVKYPPKVSVVPTKMTQPEKGIYDFDLNKDKVITWSAIGDSCNITNWDNTTVIKSNIEPANFGTSINYSPYVGVKRYNYSYTIQESLSGFSSLSSSRYGDDAVGYNIVCRDTNYLSRRESAARIVVQTYEQSLATIEQDEANNRLRFVCAPDFDSVSLEYRDVGDSSWLYVSGYPKTYSSGQSQNFDIYLSATANREYKLTCELSSVPKNKSIITTSGVAQNCINTPDLAGCTTTKQQIGDVANTDTGTGETGSVGTNTQMDSGVIIYPPTCVGSGVDSKCEIVINNGSSSSCEVSGVESPTSVLSEDIRDFTLDTSSDEWVISCGEVETTYHNPLKLNIVIKDFSITPTELPCYGGAVKASWNVANIEGGSCQVKKGSNVENITNNGSGSKTYSGIITAEKIDLICQKDINNNGNTQDNKETQIYTRYANVTCRGER